jgi:hypothetical protein
MSERLICRVLGGFVELAENDFENEVDFDTAQSLCQGLGEDWRLPTLLELKYLKQTQAERFKDVCYWSSEGNYLCFFPDQQLMLMKLKNTLGHNKYVRAVRTY